MEAKGLAHTGLNVLELVGRRQNARFFLRKAVTIVHLVDAEAEVGLVEGSFPHGKPKINEWAHIGDWDADKDGPAAGERQRCVRVMNQQSNRPWENKCQDDANRDVHLSLEDQLLHIDLLVDDFWERNQGYVEEDASKGYVSAPWYDQV